VRCPTLTPGTSVNEFFGPGGGALTAKTPGLRTSLIPDRGGIEANLAALVDGETDFFLTYAHPQVAFYLDREHFDFLTIGGDKLIPVAAPEIAVREGMRGAGLLDRALAEGFAAPFLSYGPSSFFGVALGRLFATRPHFSRLTMHENTISAGLKTVAMTGAGLCWLPESLVEAELAAGTLVLATEKDEWTLDLEIRLYRHLRTSNRFIDNLWRAVQDVSAAPGYQVHSTSMAAIGVEVATMRWALKG
jgi:DNA-binding transcriptional LysR family regulator